MKPIARSCFLTSVIYAIHLLSSGLPVDLSAAPLDPWQFRNPLPTGYPLLGATYGNGQFVAVGTGGAIVTSVDGLSWSARDSGTNAPLVGVTWAEGLFVAVGLRNTILTSPDGVTWTRRTPDGTEQIYSVTFGGGLYVAVGSSGALTSSNGVQWLRQGSIENLRDVSYGNGVFVATSWGVGSYTSPDGANWTFRDPGDGGETQRVAFGNGTFVMSFIHNLSSGPGPGLVVSSNGLDWRPVTPPWDSLESNPLEFLGSGFVLADIDGTRVAVSTDGLTWTNHSTGFLHQVGGLALGAGRYLLVGGTDGFLHSTNLVDWSFTSSGVTSTFTGYATGNGVQVVVGDLWSIGVPGESYPEGPALVWSTDGLSYSNVNNTIDEPLSRVVFGAGVFVAVGKHGEIRRSTDGREWSKRTSGTFRDLYDVAYGKGLFVAVGEDGAVVTSPTGEAWTTQASGIGFPLYGVTSRPDQFVAVGYHGVVVTSLDGVNWAVRDSETLGNLFSIANAEQGFVAVGSSGLVVTSPDAIVWTQRRVPESVHFRSVAYGAGRFVAVGPYLEIHFGGSAVLSSTNGIDWTHLPVYTSFQLYGAAYTGDSFVVLGVGGVILESSSLNSVQLRGRFVTPGFEVTVSGQTVRPLRLQARDDLADGNWIDLTLFPRVDGQATFVDTSAPTPGRFYRTVSP